MNFDKIILHILFPLHYIKILLTMRNINILDSERKFIDISYT